MHRLHQSLIALQRPWGLDLEALSEEYTIVIAACAYTFCLYTYLFLPNLVLDGW